MYKYLLTAVGFIFLSCVTTFLFMESGMGDESLYYSSLITLAVSTAMWLCKKNVFSYFLLAYFLANVIFYTVIESYATNILFAIHFFNSALSFLTIGIFFGLFSKGSQRPKGIWLLATDFIAILVSFIFQNFLLILISSFFTILRSV